MQDIFASYSQSLESPPTHVLPVTPSDTTDLSHPSRAVNVAVSGIVRLTSIEGETADLYVAEGIAFPIRASRIWQSGTTASGIVALY